MTERNTSNILTKKFGVHTRNSTYLFGEADETGVRSVKRLSSKKDPEPLDFERCKILYLEFGREMMLECIDASHSLWHTTSVYSIKPPV